MAESKRYAEGHHEEADCRKCGQPVWIVYHGPQANHTIEPRAITAYLDSLLGGLPEEAVEAMIAQTHLPPHAASVKKPTFENQLRAALTSLRDSLASGTGQQHEV